MEKLSIVNTFKIIFLFYIIFFVAVNEVQADSDKPTLAVFDLRAGPGVAAEAVTVTDIIGTEMAKTGRYQLAVTWRSAVLPGWGQYYRGDHTKGMVLMGLAPLTLFFGFRSYGDSRSANDAYTALGMPALLMSTMQMNTLSAVLFLQSQNQHDVAVHQDHRATFATGLAGLVWLYGIGDAFFLTARQDSQGSTGTSVSLRFGFRAGGFETALVTTYAITNFTATQYAEATINSFAMYGIGSDGKWTAKIGQSINLGATIGLGLFFDPSGRFFYSGLNSTNGLNSYRIDSTMGAAVFWSNTGSGGCNNPTGGRITPNGDYLYGACTASSNIGIWAVSRGGNFGEAAAQTALNLGGPTAMSVTISPDSRFLYSGMNNNTLLAYSIGANVAGHNIALTGQFIRILCPYGSKYPPSSGFRFTGWKICLSLGTAKNWKNLPFASNIFSRKC